MVRRLLACRRAAASAEFALVVPLLLLLLFGVIDAGRWLWAINQSEKATQVGARYAVVTAPMPGGLVDADYLGSGGLTQGDIIPKSAFGKVTCGSTSCCATGMACTTPYPALGTFNTARFDSMLARMRQIQPAITAANVRISYSGSGLGYAGDPNGMDVSPLVTVQLTGMQFQPLFLATLVNFPLPPAMTTLTAEDGRGSHSY